jgi:hypothetical protein
MKPFVYRGENGVAIGKVDVERPPCDLCFMNDRGDRRSGNRFAFEDPHRGFNNGSARRMPLVRFTARAATLR